MTIQDQTYISNLIIGVAYLISNTLVLILSSYRIQIRYIVLGSMTISSLSAFLVPSLSDELCIILCFTLFIIGSGTCISVVNILFVEIFPVVVCGMAISISVLSGRLGTVISSNVFGILLEEYCEPVIYGTASLIGFGIICLLLLPKKVSSR